MVPPKRKRTKRARTHDGNAYPWQCAVLGVDTATRSGWALRVAGKLIASGECDTYDPAELDDIVRLALRHGERIAGPTVLVLEKPPPFGRANIAEALGAARALWLAAWERAGQKRTRRVIRVYPVSWRSRVLGPSSVRMTRDEIRPFEQTAARQEVRFGLEIGPDEAPAILISRWGARAPEVGKCLTAKERARHG